MNKGDQHYIRKGTNPNISRPAVSRIVTSCHRNLTHCQTWRSFYPTLCWHQFSWTIIYLRVTTYNPRCSHLSVIMFPQYSRFTKSIYSLRFCWFSTVIYTGTWLRACKLSKILKKLKKLSSNQTVLSHVMSLISGESVNCC